MKLTEVGADYLDRVEGIIASLDEANHLARGDGTLKGRLRVGCATSFAVREVIPRIPEFVEAHPDLQIQHWLHERSGKPGE